MSKKPAIVHLSENFTLRKIDAKEIALKFFKGMYTNRTLPEKKIKNSSLNVLKLGKDVGNDISSEVYRFKDRNHNNQTIYTTNHSLYKYVTSEKTSELPILKCKYCKRGNLKNPIGFPVAMEFVKDDVHFHVTDAFCDFGCAFSYLKRKKGESRMFRSPLYDNAEQILYAFYYRVYPDRMGKNIKDKPEWELLRENGGSLTNEEFDNEASEYIPIPSVTLSQSKKQYIKVNFKAF